MQGIVGAELENERAKDKEKKGGQLVAGSHRGPSWDLCYF